MESNDNGERIRLNKFVGQSGLCTRREAAHRIKGGLIKVNGEIIKDPATLIKPTDLVTFGKKVLLPKTDYVYILVNKPKNTLSTPERVQDQKSIHNVFGGKIKDILSPIEPLQKSDKGLLLLTNDPALINKLEDYNPKSEVVYHVILDRPLSDEDRTRLIEQQKTKQLSISGINQVRGKDMSEIEIDVMTGQYEATRDALISLGYSIASMDRIYFNGLTKKDLSRDRFRHLTEKEVIMLKHFH